ncbi:MAG: class I SAM-dependent methyltransferase [Novosphingobium sp.]|nr:class I SAM-dependent methyltransferase [Novosphingobium sp.]
MDTYLHRNCPLCGGTSATTEVSSARCGESLEFAEIQKFWSGLFKEKVFFSYARCQACKLLYCPEYFQSDQIAQLYADMAPNMDLVPSAALVATQQGYWQAVADLVPSGGDYLEIGPDVGYVAQQAAASGKFGHFWLFEPNVAVHPTLARATGDCSNTILAEMEDFSTVPDGSVGLAVMIHVLDHLLDPLTTLSAIRSKLRPDGALLIVTHNEQSLLRKLMATRWPPFCLQHPEVYNPRSITALLEKSGYGSVNVARSTNHFPLDFMIRQAAHAFGLKLDKVPLPKRALGLKLGNIQTIARF